MRLSSDKVRKPWATGAAERRHRRRFRIGVDELVVLRHIGEGVDRRLVHRQPMGDAEFGADLGGDLVQAGNRHARPHIVPSKSARYRAV
jgi:hypothetical protein